MVSGLKAAHVMKAHRQPGQVALVSVAFAGRGQLPVVAFKDRLLELLSARPGVSVQMIGFVPGRPDWMIQFGSPCPETDLDELLRQVAQEKEVQIAIEPSRSFDQMSPDLSTFARSVFFKSPR
jgi:hypothetical protein